MRAAIKGSLVIGPSGKKGKQANQVLPPSPFPVQFNSEEKGDFYALLEGKAT
jgi:hypothetical protein